MYLNDAKPIKGLILDGVEPKHKMYLNFTAASIKTSNSCVEPKHKMYLN